MEVRISIYFKKASFFCVENLAIYGERLKIYDNGDDIMANYCDYKGILKGPKNACYGAFGCLEAYDDKRIVQGVRYTGELYAAV